MTHEQQFLMRELWDIWRTRKRGWAGDCAPDGYVYKTNRSRPKGTVQGEGADLEARRAAYRAEVAASYKR